jgi:heme-binding NEAT domain protein
MARKAMQFDKGGQAKVSAAKKKVAKVPKTMKPGAPKPQEQINQEQVAKHKAKLKKSGKLDDAMELLRARR